MARPTSHLIPLNVAWSDSWGFGLMWFIRQCQQHEQAASNLARNNPELKEPEESVFTLALLFWDPFSGFCSNTVNMHDPPHPYTLCSCTWEPLCRCTLLIVSSVSPADYKAFQSITHRKTVQWSVKWWERKQKQMTAKTFKIKCSHWFPITTLGDEYSRIKLRFV